MPALLGKISRSGFEQVCERASRLVGLVVEFYVFAGSICITDDIIDTALFDRAIAGRYHEHFFPLWIG